MLSTLSKRLCLPQGLALPRHSLSYCLVLFSWWTFSLSIIRFNIICPIPARCKGHSAWPILLT